MNNEDDIVLSVRNISKTFPGVKALENVSMDLHAGEVTAVIGENGAGKSTLMKILSGIYRDYTGNLLFREKEIFFQNPHHAQESGVAIIHQELNLIPYLTVRENIYLGRELTTPAGFLDKKKMDQQCRQILIRLNQEIDPQVRIADLKVGQQQMVEIAKALIMDASVIIMDEPTSALSDSEVEVLFNVIKDLKSQGKAIAYISHKLKELFTIADNYVILRDGCLVDSGKMEDMDQDNIIRKMIGRNIGFLNDREKTAHNTGKCLEVRNLSLQPEGDHRLTSLKGINFSLNKGEILGIYGLMGAGRTELLETIFGMHPSISYGEIVVNGQKCDFKSPGAAINEGLALIPEDRKKDGLLLDMNVMKNISLASLSRFQKYGVLMTRKERSLAKRYVDEIKIKTPSIRQKVLNLSGGNQQKVVLAKWLATDPTIFLFDEPTRGIDINAKSEIYEIVRQLASEGKGIIVASSELPEILAISDRIMVMCEGQLTVDFPVELATEEKIMEAAIPNQ